MYKTTVLFRIGFKASVLIKHVVCAFSHFPRVITISNQQFEIVFMSISVSTVACILKLFKTFFTLPNLYMTLNSIIILFPELNLFQACNPHRNSHGTYTIIPRCTMENVHPLVFLWKSPWVILVSWTSPEKGQLIMLFTLPGPWNQPLNFEYFRWIRNALCLFLSYIINPIVNNFVFQVNSQGWGIFFSGFCFVQTFACGHAVQTEQWIDRPNCILTKICQAEWK